MGVTAMKLEEMASGAVQLLNVCSWRSVWDFDAPGISQRVQLERLHYAIVQAIQGCTAPECEAELNYVLADCEALLALPELEDETAAVEYVPSRVARIKRIVTYHEGHLARLNRCFWWIPFSILLLIVTACCLPSIVAMVEDL